MLEEHLYEKELDVQRDAGQTPPIGESIASATLAASFVVMEVLRILTGTALPTLLNGGMTVSPMTGQIETHRIQRVPHCPECSRGSDFPFVADVLDG